MEKEIVEYMITTQDTRGGLEENVNYLIKQGRQPIGGICVKTSDYGPTYAQAMVKFI